VRGTAWKSPVTQTSASPLRSRGRAVGDERCRYAAYTDVYALRCRPQRLRGRRTNRAARVRRRPPELTDHPRSRRRQLLRSLRCALRRLCCVGRGHSVGRQGSCGCCYEWLANWRPRQDMRFDSRLWGCRVICQRAAGLRTALPSSSLGTFLIILMMMIDDRVHLL
jgi:hypothetical protein